MPPCSCPPPVIPAGSGRVVLRKEPASIMAGSRRLGRRGGRWEAGILQPRVDLAAWRAGNSGPRYEDGRPRSRPCARIASRSVHGDARAASRRRSCRRRRNRPLCARAQSLGTSWPDAASRRPGVRGRLLRPARMRRAAPPPADQRDMHAFGPGRGAHCPAPRPSAPIRVPLPRPGCPLVGPRRHAPRPSPSPQPLRPGPPRRRRSRRLRAQRQNRIAGRGRACRGPPMTTWCRRPRCAAAGRPPAQARAAAAAAMATM